MSINKKTFRPDDFLFGMKRFPYILFLGSSFEIDEFDNKKILDLPWSCVITSLIDENVLNDALDNKERKTRNIFAKTANDANEQRDVSRSENFSDRHNLKIVRLFNNEEKISSRGAQVNAKEGFSHVVQSVGAQSVRLVIVGYKKNDHFDLDRMMDCFLEKNSLKGVKTFIFDTDAQDDFLKLFKENEENYSTVEMYSNSLSELLEDFLDEQFDEEGDFSEASSDDYIFYAKGKIKSLDKEKHLNEYRFLNLLHEEEMENIVPPYMLENWFYAFLKQSPYEPQWYGYHEQNKFCLERDIDERLYNKCLKGLENPGDQDQKPIVVLGNSGSGKSIAVANLAYRIFSEHRYPVIFQNNLDNFLSDDDSAFTKLDNLLMFLEGSGAPAILLIIDKSVAGDSESDKLLHIFLKLRNHGRNLTMVFTSYNHSISYKNLSKYFVSISMENKLSTKELSSLRTLLKLKAKIKSKETIDELVKLAETKDDFLVFLYYAFQDLRKPLEKGIYEEFQRTIELAIDKKNLQNDIRELLISVAIASQFKKGIPCNLAYRLINSLDEETISAISRIPSFSYRHTEEDNYEFRIRTPLEADMLLRHLNKNNSETKIEYIKKMLDKLRIEKDEITFMIGILRCIGPNAPDKYKRDAKSYRHFYDKIIEALKNFRINNKGGDLSMILQEITYIREHAIHLINDKKISDEEYVDRLKSAIKIGNNGVNSSQRYPAQSRSRNRTVVNLLIEISNSRLYLYNSDPLTYEKDLLQAQNELKEVIVANPDRENTAYAYTILMRSMINEYENLNPNIDATRRFELLAEGYDFIKWVENEYSKVYENDHFYPNAEKLAGFFEDQKLSDDMFDDMIKRQKSIGIYCRACRQLKEAGIEPYRRVQAKITDEQVLICRKVCDELLDNPEYKEKTDLEINLGCQRLLLHVVWLMYDRYPLFCEENHRTGISAEGWEKLKEICERNNNLYEQTKKTTMDYSSYHKYHKFLYVLALCYAQLDTPKKCQEIIKEIRDGTYNWIYGNRIVIRHIICDENRVPKSDFKGEFVDIKPEGNDGHIKITDWSGLNGKEGIYFHKRNLNNLPVKMGGYHKDFQLGLGYMGLSVFHGLKGGNQ